MATSSVTNDRTKQDSRREVEPWEIGGALLDILSRGLYSDARDALREYIQNGVDAGASTIYVTVEGSTVTIHDDGHGMSEAGLHAARRFGVSDKSPLRNVGYRGIGIYSSFGMCETLSVLTRPRNSEEEFELSFEFGKMRRLLERDRMKEVRGKVGLADLLRGYTHFHSRAYDGEDDEPFTLITLDGLGQEYRAQLNDSEDLYEYLLRTLPVEFPQESYGRRVNGWIRKHVELNPLKRLVLRVGNEDEQVVQPQLAESVFQPERRWIEDPEGQPVAFVWYSLTKKAKKIPIEEGTSGFLLKMRGFTLGDRTLLHHLWPRVGGGVLFHRFTGEVHVLNTARVYPNAGRDDLEPSPSKQALENRLEETFQALNTYAADYSAIASAETAVRTRGTKVEALKGEVRAADVNPFETFSEANKQKEHLEKRLDELQAALRRKGSLLREAQRKRGQSARDDIRALLKSVNSVLRRAKNRTERNRQSEEEQKEPRRSREKVTPQPPRSDILRRIISQLESEYEETRSTHIRRAQKGIAAARGANSRSQVAGILDSLKVAIEDLPEGVDHLRMEIRGMIGLSPEFPVSLEEGLAEEGFFIETDREETLVQAVDSGMHDIFGRGAEYDGMLAAILSHLDDILNSDPSDAE